MFKRWKTLWPAIIAIGSLVAWIITILAFFGVDWKTLKANMTAHWIFLVVSIVCLVVFIWATWIWRQNSKVTPENVQARIRGWLHDYNFDHALSPSWDKWHFGYRVPLDRGPLLFIARTRARPDYIMFMGKITAVAPDDQPAFEALTKLEQRELYYRLRLETSRARFFFFSDSTLNQVTFESWIPITALTTEMFGATVNEMYFSANILWSTISLQLGKKPELSLSDTPTPAEKGPPQITSEDAPTSKDSDS